MTFVKGDRVRMTVLAVKTFPRVRFGSRTGVVVTNSHDPRYVKVLRDNIKYPIRYSVSFWERAVCI